jgi:hypothetical protein
MEIAAAHRRGAHGDDDLSHAWPGVGKRREHRRSVTWKQQSLHDPS